MFGTFRQRPCAWKGLVAGLAGGVVATVVMTQFQKAWSKASEALQSRDQGESNNEQKDNSNKEDATMKAAGKVAAVAGRTLSHEEKKKAGPVIHYGFGTAVGALYGLACEFTPLPVKNLHPALAGSGYGTALFLGADEVAIPALGLSEAPSETPWSGHLYGWASHLVYGLTLEMVRKTVRQSL